MNGIDSVQYQLLVSNANQNESQVPVRYLSKLSQHMNERVILFAIVTSIKPPFKTKGTDYSMSLVVHDPTLPATSDGLSINMFDSDMEKFGQLKSGDIVSHFGTKIQAVINKRKEGSVVSVDKIELNDQEREIVAILSKFKGPVRQEKVYSSVRPVTLIKDIVPNGYYDFFGKKGHGCILLGMTDFTANPLLQISQDQIPYNNPVKVPNDMLVVVTCWDLRCNIELGMYVSVRNARSKLDLAERLEMVVHEDTRYMDRLPIKEADRTNEREKDVLQNVGPHETIKLEAQSTVKYPAAVIAQPRSNANTFTSIKDVKACTESKKFRVKVRIVDYMPFKLEWFTRPYCQYCNQALNLIEGVTEYTCPTCNDQIGEYIFLFSLLVTDDNQHFIPLIFSEMQIEFLEEFYPVPMMNDNEVVGQLRERLGKYITFVGLDRIKDSAEMECLIKSFYVDHKDGQVQRYKFLSLLNK
ncbi:hypothetical protein HK103_002684 [Boothiomyces macroporosus]|uniref:Telomeric single stranded DNA binding POT1/Cdc13 domain-containing protein n=1 Tax=Boothiomyces macroporosus TaxID=261099 RepID=A0AAD5Y6H1_9FUNG|nr:hypothetical protein HK103_002684 [Boothiomyces macroporosus]